MKLCFPQVGHVTHASRGNYSLFRFVAAARVEPCSFLPITKPSIPPSHTRTTLQFQRGLILGHVELLEPRWKDDPAPMRIFTAPLDSEVEVARNVHDLTRVLGPGKGKDVKVCTVGSPQSCHGGSRPLPRCAPPVCRILFLGLVV